MEIFFDEKALSVCVEYSMHTNQYEAVNDSPFVML